MNPVTLEGWHGRTDPVCWFHTVRVVAAAGAVGVALLLFASVADRAHAQQAATGGTPVIVPNPEAEPREKIYEFAVFKKHCTQCHNSVADPERPGKTRDEWYRIVNLMESHGLVIPQADADLIVDLLYNLRRGIEDTPG